MAAATTSPVKILSDLGYEIWEMEIPEDFRSALIEAINTLIMSNPSDGRIPILQEAIRAVQKPKFKAKKTRLNVDKVLNKTQPRLEGQKLQEDSEEVQSNNDSLSSILVPRLDGISSALSGIGSILASQLSLERIAYERQRKRDLLNEKREREKSLENEGNTIGKTIKKIIQQPIKSFGERLLQFLKGIALGAAVLSLYKWLQDEENLKKVKDIADWLGNNGAKLINGLLKLGRLKIASKLGSVVKKLGSIFIDAVLLKPFRTFIELFRRSSTNLGKLSSLTPGAKYSKILRQVKFRERRGILEIINQAKEFNPQLLKGVNRKELLNLKVTDIVEFLSKQGLSDIEISEVLKRASKSKNFSKGSKLFVQNTITSLDKSVSDFTAIDKARKVSKAPLLDIPSFIKGSNLEKQSPEAYAQAKKLVRTSEYKRMMFKLLRFLEKNKLGNLEEVKTLRKTLVGAPFRQFLKAVSVLDIGLDTMGAVNNFKKGNAPAAAFYALAALTSVGSFAFPPLGLPSLGFSLLAFAAEDPATLEGLKKGGSTLGLPVPGAGLGGAGGIEGTIPFMFNRSSIDTPMSQDMASFMPIDSNDSGGNIAMLGGNGSQSTPSSGTGSNSDVVFHSSVNDEDPVAPSVAAIFGV